MMTKKKINKFQNDKNWKENISKQQRWWTFFIIVQINLFIIENIAAEHWTLNICVGMHDRRSSNELVTNKSQIASSCDQNVSWNEEKYNQKYNNK